MLDIIQLSKDRVDEVILLLNSVFPDDINRYNNPEIGIRCAFDREKYRDYYSHFRLLKTTPFVLLLDNKIIGVTGLYHLKSDPIDTVWLGWFCVEPSHRKKGFGKMLLEWTIKKAKKEGYKKLKVYTSDDPELEIGRKLYDEFGFKNVGQEPGEGETLIYKELIL